MYPLTHLFFAEKIMGRINHEIALGSVFPDMCIGQGVTRDMSHNHGLEIMAFLGIRHELNDFALANITHGVKPRGLDYYADEEYHPGERGYCFEKGRILIKPTIEACNIPPAMGWWKAHNIVEMGIELLISAMGPYREYLACALANRSLLEKIGDRMDVFFCQNSAYLAKRMSRFPTYIDLGDTTAESLAAKYDYQMLCKHCLHIDIPRVSRLILQASEIVRDDLEEFFARITADVKRTLVMAEIKNKPLSGKEQCCH